MVIEAYAKYDCSKKGRPIPDFATWEWSSADGIDEEMRCAGLKQGVPAGYLLWDRAELTLPVLRDCAVFGGMFPEQPRKLGLIERNGALIGWKPDRECAWFREVVDGLVFDETAPFLLRPAVRAEKPASWYVEDGSGRAVALLANQHRFNSSQTVGIGYLARTPDENSSFMKQTFPELLPSASR